MQDSAATKRAFVRVGRRPDPGPQVDNAATPAQIKLALRLRIARSEDEAILYGKAALTKMIGQRIGYRSRTNRGWQARNR
jgi:hypothetical protein